MKISDLVTMIFRSALLVLPSFILSTIFSSFILALPMLVTNSIFSKFPMIKKFCFIIHATVLGCLVTAISLSYSDDAITAIPGIVLGYVTQIPEAIRFSGNILLIFAGVNLYLVRVSSHPVSPYAQGRILRLY